MKRLSTGALKGMTIAFLVLGFGLMLAAPIILRRPADGDRRAFARNAATFVGGFVVAIAGAGIGAFLLVRRARDEYRELALRNMQDLLEAARQDQLRKQQATSDDE